MNDRDRLAADLRNIDYMNWTAAENADRLIALGWTRRPYIGYWSAEGDLRPEIVEVLRDELPKALDEGKQIVVVDSVTLRFHEIEPSLDEERLARAVLRGFYIEWCQLPWDDVDDWKKNLDEAFEWYATANQIAAAIAKAYREDTDAHD